MLATVTSSPLVSSSLGAGYPVGTASSSAPSGEAPPSSTALPGYRESYVNDFNGSSLPSGWSAFSGTPGGDPGSLWTQANVVVGSGLLQLNTWQDPASNNQWVSGGLCQCGVANTYGAYFVRSKLTGSGPTQVELLWPTSGWPPEIDFNETRGGATSSVATLHFTSANLQEHRTVNVDMTQWHTWGVIWTPTSITYTVDGRVWGVMDTASEIPTQPMTLDITQQTWCSSGFACPTTPESTQVDWVAEYRSSLGASSSASVAADTVTVSPFATNSSTLSSALKLKIAKLALEIKSNRYSTVRLVGYSDKMVTHSQNLVVSRDRAMAVEQYLRHRLAILGVVGVTISATAMVNVRPGLSTTIVAPLAHVVSK